MTSVMMAGTFSSGEGKERRRVSMEKNGMHFKNNTGKEFLANRTLPSQFTNKSQTMDELSTSNSYPPIGMGMVLSSESDDSRELPNLGSRMSTFGREYLKFSRRGSGNCTINNFE
jgi:hypothetical protein